MVDSTRIKYGCSFPIYEICQKVEATALAKRLIYLEWHSDIDGSLLPEKWSLLKQKKSGSVFFALCSRH